MPVTKQLVTEISYRGPFSSILSAPSCYSQTIRNITVKNIPADTVRSHEPNANVQIKHLQNDGKNGS